MKTIDSQVIAGLIFASAVYLASGGDVLMQAKFVKANCIVHDPIMVQNVSCWVKSINRTYSVSNLRATVTSVLTKISVNFQLFQRTQVNYRPFLINVTDDYCAYFSKNQGSKYLRILGSMIMPYTNMNHTCPYTGDVAIRNVPLDSTRFPALWPKGEFRLDVLVIGDERRLITMQFFAEVLEKPLMWQ